MEGKGKGRKRTIDGNVSISGSMMGDKSPAFDAKKEGAAVRRTRGKKKKTDMNKDSCDELCQGRRNTDKEKVEEGKESLNTVKDKREHVQASEAAEKLSSSGTESEEPDENDGKYNHVVLTNALFCEIITAALPWKNLMVFTVDQR